MKPLFSTNKFLLAKREWRVASNGLRTMSLVIGIIVAFSILFAASLEADEPTGQQLLDIVSRRELFVDSFLVDRLDNATLKLHERTWHQWQPPH